MINPVDKVWEELYVGVKDLIKQNIGFKGILKGITSKLEALKPVIGQMVRSNEELDRSKEELKGLQEVMDCGIELIRKCKKLRVWWLFKKYKYAYKLIEWDKTLQGQLVILNVQTARDVKETARDVKETARDVKETAARVRNVEASVVTLVYQFTANAVIQSQLAKPRALMSAGLVVPELPRFTVGLDAHLKELKMKLLKDGVSMLVLTAPGGCGKTTLANMLYHDQDVKGNVQ